MGERKAAVAFYSCSFFLLGCVISSLGPALIEVVRRAGHTIDDGSSGLLVTARSMGYLACSLLTGIVLDRFLIRFGNGFILVGLVLCALSMTAFCFMYSYVGQMLLLVLVGANAGMLDVCANVLMIRLFDDPLESQPYIQTLHAAFAVGAAVCPLFVTEMTLLTSDTSSYNVPFFIISSLFVPVIALGIWISIREPTASPGLEVGKEQTFEGGVIPPRVKMVVVALFGIVFLLYVGSEVAFGLFVYTYAKESHLHWTDTMSGAVTTTFWGCFAAGRIVSIFLSAKKVSATLLVAVSIVATSIFVCLPLFPALFDGKGDGPLLWISAVGTGFAMAPTFPSIFNYCSSRMEITPRISSVFVICSAFGEMLLPLLIGELFRYSFRSLFAVISVASGLGFLCVLAAFFILKRKSVEKYQELEMMQDSSLSSSLSVDGGLLE